MHKIQFNFQRAEMSVCEIICYANECFRNSMMTNKMN